MAQSQSIVWIWLNKRDCERNSGGERCRWMSGAQESTQIISQFANLKFILLAKSAIVFIAVSPLKFLFRHVASCLLCLAGQIMSVYWIRKAVAQEIKASRGQQSQMLMWVGNLIEDHNRDHLHANSVVQKQDSSELLMINRLNVSSFAGKALNNVSCSFHTFRMYLSENLWPRYNLTN